MIGEKIDTSGVHIIKWANGNIKHEFWDADAHSIKTDTGREYIYPGYRHRLDGPAYSRFNEDGSLRYEEWYVLGDDITEEVEKWIADNDLKHWSTWDDQTRMRFKLTFG